MPAIILVPLLLALLWIAFCGYRWGWGPFATLHPLDAGRLPGNAAAYSIERVEPLAGSALKGTTIIFLGSSVTYGAASKGISFVDYIANRWSCPVVFYTNPRYESAAYGEMVTLLKEIASKWDISIIDLWDDEGFNVITPEERKLYMADAIHPTQAGYLKWWTPKIGEGLSEAMRKDAR